MVIPKNNSYCRERTFLCTYFFKTWFAYPWFNFSKIARQGFNFNNLSCPATSESDNHVTTSFPRVLLWAGKSSECMPKVNFDHCSVWKQQTTNNQRNNKNLLLLNIAVTAVKKSLDNSYSKLSFNSICQRWTPRMSHCHPF